MQPKKRFQDSKSRVYNKKLHHASWMKLKSEEGGKVSVKETENSDFYAKEKIENSKGSKNYYHRQAPSYGHPLPLLPHHPTAAHGHHGYQVDNTPSMFSVINLQTTAPQSSLLMLTPHQTHLQHPLLQFPQTEQLCWVISILTEP